MHEHSDLLSQTDHIIARECNFEKRLATNYCGGIFLIQIILILGTFMYYYRTIGVARD